MAPLKGQRGRVDAGIASTNTARLASCAMATDEVIAPFAAWTSMVRRKGELEGVRRKDRS